MNQLSWLLYLADLSQGLSSLFGFTAFMLLVISAIMIVICITMNDDNDDHVPWWIPITSTPLCFVLAILCIALPSKDTVYAIAASQIGEQVIKTPLAGKAEKALETWLDKQTAKTEAK